MISINTTKNEDWQAILLTGRGKVPETMLFRQLVNMEPAYRICLGSNDV